MSSASAYTAIRDFLETRWTAAPMGWENEPFTPPKGRNGAPLPFVLVSLAGAGCEQVSIGATHPGDNRFREFGLLWLHVFVPSGSGTLAARQYAGTFVSLFRGFTTGGVVFGETSIGQGEPGDENGNYWRTSVSVAWHFDS